MTILHFSLYLKILCFRRYLPPQGLPRVGILSLLTQNSAINSQHSTWQKVRAQRCCRSVTHLCPTLRPHELQPASFLCPPLSPRLCSNSCPLSWWCHPTISTSVASSSSCPQSFPASRSFPMSQLFSSGGQSTGPSASGSVLPVNIQGWFPLGLTDLLAVQGTLKKLLQHHNLKASTLQRSAFFMVQLTFIHGYGKTIALTMWTFVSKVMSLLFITLSLS